jgi:hypothetical protein
MWKKKIKLIKKKLNTYIFHSNTIDFLNNFSYLVWFNREWTPKISDMYYLYLFLTFLLNKKYNFNHVSKHNLNFKYIY